MWDVLFVMLRNSEGNRYGCECARSWLALAAAGVVVRAFGWQQERLGEVLSDEQRRFELVGGICGGMPRLEACRIVG